MLRTTPARPGKGFILFGTNVISEARIGRRAPGSSSRPLRRSMGLASPPQACEWRLWWAIGILAK
jgi:hypothetical protein